jgi:hypothetical protein
MAPGTVDRSLQTAEGVAIGVFIALTAAALLILWPWKWTFRVSAKHYLKRVEASPGTWTTEKLQREMALWIEIHVKRNQTKLNCLLWVFRLGCFLLGVEVVAWLIDLT